MGNCLASEERHASDEKPGLENSHVSTSKQQLLKKSESLPVAPKDIEFFRMDPGNENIDNFTYHEMKLATKNFRPDKILGEGGFGIVYKGIIDEDVRPGYNSIEVAVKDLNPDGLQGDKEWLAEVTYLSRLSHPNLVRLIGYCCEDEHRLLVYEYMSCGSCDEHLFQRVKSTISWSNRIKIALGTAKGLAFLHGSERPIIYRDFKTSNILLDAEYNAKLSDFGLAKEGPTGDKTHVSTRVVGTFGYAAPEYLMTGHLTSQSDVYGFGVVLLEMLIGQRAVDERRPKRHQNIVDWVLPILIHPRKLIKILDPRMKGQYSMKQVQKVANLTYQCLSHRPGKRPTMKQVVEVLESVHFKPDTIDITSNDDQVEIKKAPKVATDEVEEEKNQLIKKPVIESQ